MSQFTQRDPDTRHTKAGLESKNPKSKRVNNEITGAKNWRTSTGAQKMLEDTGLTQRQKTDEPNKEEEHKEQRRDTDHQEHGGIGK